MHQVVILYRSPVSLSLHCERAVPVNLRGQRVTFLILTKGNDCRSRHIYTHDF